MACCEEHEYRTIIMNLRMYDKWSDTWYHDERKLQSMLSPVLNEIQSIKVDGLIYIAGHGRVLHCLPDDFSLPTVIAYAKSENNRFPSIVLDDERGGYEMMKYLMGQGHKRIGIIAGASDNMHTQERLLGCQKALFEENIPYNPKWTFYGDWERGSGYQGAKALCGENVTAIWCMNDLMAGGAYDYAHEKGVLIGKDIAIAGYDNRQVSDYFFPGLTTCELPLKEIGYRSAEKLISGLEGKEEMSGTAAVKVPCTMIYRDSVGKK